VGLMRFTVGLQTHVFFLLFFLFLFFLFYWQSFYSCFSLACLREGFLKEVAPKASINGQRVCDSSRRIIDDGGLFDKCFPLFLLFKISAYVRNDQRGVNAGLSKKNQKQHQMKEKSLLPKTPLQGQMSAYILFLPLQGYFWKEKTHTHFGAPFYPLLTDAAFFLLCFRTTFVSVKSKKQKHQKR
jgi:hypothetical protein